MKNATRLVRLMSMARAVSLLPRETRRAWTKVV
jgi:hypothetical protein